ncbi:aldolase [Fusobacterium hwasookii]|uniref:aldolase/citrate lyase family protein n=1 Tax=Fusobacterium hwasookii TaxID=1583098 RepID=UPI00049763E3|nr:aldolase/citrate lyase family protein [Fusobacterium hwasookii]QNE69133.1 aldolase [Fusobacterium hwasookii]
MELLYITNEVETAKNAEISGVNIVFIDLEKKGKMDRQGHLDTVISNHCIEDIQKVRKELKNTKLLVRVNPLDNESSLEIEQVIKYGADIIMLPMFKTAYEVRKFIELIKGRAEVCLLLETSQALCRIDEILETSGIDRIHIGLNDLHLSLGLDFMFECLSGGLVEYLTEKISKKGIKYGFGGIARIGEGELPAEKILKEHVRLGSQMVILSRTFKRTDKDLKLGVQEIKREYTKDLKLTREELDKNKEEVKKIIEEISYKRRKNVL